MPDSSQWLALGVSALILAAIGWAGSTELQTAHPTVGESGGQRYNQLFPSEQGALAACTVCHRISADGPEASAPALWGIVGSEKGRSPWFGYSIALASQQGRWTADEIDAYLTDPVAYLPGTIKTLSRVRDADERKRIIEALQRLSP